MARGTLRVYLGAAPGVGKTFAMLAEGRRRHERGTDVVVAVVETHGRANTAAELRDLEVVPRRRLEHRGAVLDEMDLDAVLARRPEVALVDELAHTNVPGSRHEKRWQDVECLLEAGIDVVTTVNIQHLESLNDVVAAITGVTQQETVPDEVVRRADQIELVDMSPEALRRRMAHGNIYPAERIDAALANYFRAGNLGALRELALLWVADRVEDALDDYRARHGITATWETRERVVVAVTGAPGTEQLVRRAARIAGRARGALVAVHVDRDDGLATGPPAEDGDALARIRDLVHDLGGRFVRTTGDDVAMALVRVARAEEATQIVLGASGRRRWQEWLRGSVISRVVRDATGIDVHVIAGRGERAIPLPRAGVPALLSRRRQAAAWALLVVGLPVLTVVLTAARGAVSLPTDLLLFLVLVVAAGAVGGFVPSLVGAVAGSILANYYFVPPFHTLSIADGENVLALVVFVVVAAVVSTYVHLAAARSRAARRARAEAEALVRASATLVGSPDPLPELVDHLRTTVGLEGVAVAERDEEAGTTVGTGGDLAIVAASGAVALDDPDAEVFPLGRGSGHVLVTRGRLGDADRIVLRSLADQLTLALDARRNAADATRARALQEADALRTALLRAVSHDLRTPLAGIKASVTSLLSDDVDWDEPTQREFLATIDAEADRLERLLSNLLDLSRLQAGTVPLQAGPVAVDDLVSAAVASLSAADPLLVLDVPDTLPVVVVDPALVERALANILANALAWSPAGRPVRVEAALLGDGVRLRVIDRGPGIALRDRDRVVLPFQRLGDGGDRGGGIGLGLAVARGFTEAVGGHLALEDTPGGGLTVELTLPVAASRPLPEPSVP